MTICRDDDSLREALIGRLAIFANISNQIHNLSVAGVGVLRLRHSARFANGMAALRMTEMMDTFSSGRKRADLTLR